MQESQEIRRIALSLAGGRGAQADPAGVAAKVGTVCLAIEAAIAPIVGQRGVAALYKRSLHLAGRAHPWLAGASGIAPCTADVTALLKTSLSAQSGIDSATGGAAFLQAFHDLLTSLLGAALTERLLRSVWIDFLIDTPAQDHSP